MHAGALLYEKVTKVCQGVSNGCEHVVHLMTFGTSAYVFVCCCAGRVCPVKVINAFVFGVGAAIREVWWWRGAAEIGFPC